ncbi:DUF4468 domain-containing protein [Bacteroidales bacterium OttesenSCG-928-B11]|nr:DUF4468 domain-containing protein [Bacteroidales bacterium OttesenSCG-928-E04]MDL2311399.1 DUF4468 domain-containing protein [Bacteroidales bacterium OttesenSCG-928-B11]MDL2325795.1 DUF4468 domain-containing protein [Bacteroidales bacterium OttesenSCG-928-A14]
MKKIILGIFLTTLFSVAFSQKDKGIDPPYLPMDEDTKLVTYKEVVNEKGSPQELYDRAMEWVKKYYKNTGEVIKNADREKGVITMRSSVKIYVTLKDGTKKLKNIVYYNFKLECRQDRYRFTITDFNEKATSASPIEEYYNTKNPLWSLDQYQFLIQIDEQIKELIESLEEGMYPKVEKVDEW